MLRVVAILCLAGGAAVAGLTAQPAPAQAETLYPWCVQYAGGPDGIGGTSCAFVSRAQCQQTAMGMGAFCVQNPAYPEASAPRPRPRHRQR